jgi:aspartyl-tRNA(Asn)/glutamyl-tRNA(Gln) amidotransferase subunit A
VDYTLLTLLEASKLLKDRKVTSVELTKSFLQKIEQTKKLNTLITICKADALATAEKADKIIQSGVAYPALTGLPIIIKDNISTKGVRTTCGSKFLKNYIPPYNATVVEKLNAQNAVLLGKANMDEFAMGGSNEHSAYGNVLNPLNNEYVPGGSSGGSASAVGANLCLASLGSDTGGSIRQPAAYCGLIGLKPTYGLVSRFGLVAFASSLDQIGPLTKTVKDSALLLSVIAGSDEKDSTSEKFKLPDYNKCFTDSIRGLKVGISKEYLNLFMSDETKVSVNSVIEFLKQHGATLVDINLKNIDLSLSVYYVVACAEAASNLSRFDGVKYGVRAKDYKNLSELYFKSRTQGFGEEVKRRIMLGNFVLSSGYFDAYYKRAKKAQQAIKCEFEKAFNICDVIISPTTPSTAFKFGEKTDNPVEMYAADVYTVPVNIAELPAISIPCGKGQNNMPIGIQLIGKKFSECTLLNTADYIEKHYSWEGK